MTRHICVHSHFYQPPRENPWLEAVEVQPSAYPFHDWNQRITAECYAPNALARILDDQGWVTQITNNYARISFNFGPTLLSWLEENDPTVYNAILEADQESLQRFDGHGSAMAQVYNHIIMPLANRRDKETQVRWGLEDFRRRFGRDPEGMWLAETAVDTETLEILADHGIRFTILEPGQAQAFRAKGDEEWTQASNGEIDPKRPYLVNLPNGKHINVFFYDGPISRAVAFEGLLEKGEKLAHRLANAFSDSEDPQLVHVATDGETYGHHHKHGDMALAYALHFIEEQGLAKLTNYGQYLELYPPQFEAQIKDNTAWSCAHGVGRWKEDCGCNISHRQGWNQKWRGPLRKALDVLRDGASEVFESTSSEHELWRGFEGNSWRARDAYIRVILDRSRAQNFLDEAQVPEEHRQLALKLLEMQRHSLLMYTSCAWFFDELSGIETVQCLQYAGRVLQILKNISPAAEGLKLQFLQELEEAQSNLPSMGNGVQVYQKFVEPAVVSLDKVAAHYAVNHLFDVRPRDYAYETKTLGPIHMEAGNHQMVLGQMHVRSTITWDESLLNFGVFHFGDHNLIVGVRPHDTDAALKEFETEAREAFGSGDLTSMVRVFDRHFENRTFHLKDLFKNEQRQILNRILEESTQKAQTMYADMYQKNATLIRFLVDSGAPLPEPFLSIATFVNQDSLRSALAGSRLDAGQVRELLDESRDWGLEFNQEEVGQLIEGRLQQKLQSALKDPSSSQASKFIEEAHDLLALSKDAENLELRLWPIQNLYFRLSKSVDERGSLGSQFEPLGQLLQMKLHGHQG